MPCDSRSDDCHHNHWWSRKPSALFLFYMDRPWYCSGFCMSFLSSKPLLWRLKNVPHDMLTTPRSSWTLFVFGATSGTRVSHLWPWSDYFYVVINMDFYACSHGVVFMLSTIVIMTKSARLSQKKQTLPPKRCVTGVSLHCQDQSGYISLDELLNGYDKLPEFQEQMRLMDVEREDMQLGYLESLYKVGPPRSLFSCSYIISPL